jgi:hypothetical protein
MAERWQWVKPTTYDRALYDGEDNHGVAEIYGTADEDR